MRTNTYHAAWLYTDRFALPSTTSAHTRARVRAHTRTHIRTQAEDRLKAEAKKIKENVKKGVQKGRDDWREKVTGDRETRVRDFVRLSSLLTCLLPAFFVNCS